jgi:hypothetical protein
MDMLSAGEGDEAQGCEQTVAKNGPEGQVGRSQFRRSRSTGQRISISGLPSTRKMQSRLAFRPQRQANFGFEWLATEHGYPFDCDMLQAVLDYQRPTAWIAPEGEREAAMARRKT